MRRPLFVISFAISTFLFSLSTAFPIEYKTFRTDNATIHYAQDILLSDFLWRIGRLKFEHGINTTLARSRVDRIIERVQTVLDMYPEDFRVDIYLTTGYKGGYIAFYSFDKETITVYTDRVTDGVLAHEIAHAVMHRYFEVPPPRKIQEILCRYADSHLWEDY
ncbi:MAG: hypothetical protein ISS26_08075 [Candidatus Omnitrophica bacterium]|nr:hypothetical protein [Candidatus Omnitrophota bacterium]